METLSNRFIWTINYFSRLFLSNSQKVVYLLWIWIEGVNHFKHSWFIRSHLLNAHVVHILGFDLEKKWWNFDTFSFSKSIKKVMYFLATSGLISFYHRLSNSIDLSTSFTTHRNFVAHFLTLQLKVISSTQFHFKHGNSGRLIQNFTESKNIRRFDFFLWLTWFQLFYSKSIHVDLILFISFIIYDNSGQEFQVLRIEIFWIYFLGTCRKLWVWSELERNVYCHTCYLGSYGSYCSFCHLDDTTW